MTALMTACPQCAGPREGGPFGPDKACWRCWCEALGGGRGLLLPEPLDEVDMLSARPSRPRVRELVAAALSELGAERS